MVEKNSVAAIRVRSATHLRLGAVAVKQIRNLSRMQLIRTLAAWRPDLTGFRDPTTATKIALKHLARRYLELHDEIADFDRPIHALVEELEPTLLERVGVGYQSAAQLLITAGANPEGLTSEASFAMLCGAAPLPASSGMTTRHRHNRGDDRAANSALHMIAVSRWRMDPKTQAYVARKRAFGHSNPEILRCLKRFITREILYLLKDCDRVTPQSHRPLDTPKGVNGTPYTSKESADVPGVGCAPFARDRRNMTTR
ncbi:transposase [Rhodococcus opacus RKJ300 = JCM 13270]|uniref:Transposase n=1 Tax=Rhodococcus opacus RKJ300 = JCM 13270 TaxID=1165867 RepID=I0WLT0_RHOOP|nr:transposase [Rhodococcus opacus RKJ300 = JCM 13270]